MSALSCWSRSVREGNMVVDVASVPLAAESSRRYPQRLFQSCQPCIKIRNSTQHLLITHPILPILYILRPSSRRPTLLPSPNPRSLPLRTTISSIRDFNLRQQPAQPLHIVLPFLFTLLPLHPTSTLLLRSKNPTLLHLPPQPRDPRLQPLFFLDITSSPDSIPFPFPIHTISPIRTPRVYASAFDCEAAPCSLGIEASSTYDTNLFVVCFFITGLRRFGSGRR